MTADGKKPREFWVNVEFPRPYEDEDCNRYPAFDKDLKQDHHIHVIEKSAFEAIFVELEHTKRQCEWERVHKKANDGGMKVVMRRLEACEVERDALLVEVARLKAALSFYARKEVWGNGGAAIDPCDTYTCELGVLRGGKRAIEALRSGTAEGGE